MRNVIIEGPIEKHEIARKLIEEVVKEHFRMKKAYNPFHQAPGNSTTIIEVPS